jgi:Protein of unknown function (DUF3142)
MGVGCRRLLSGCLSRRSVMAGAVAVAALGLALAVLRDSPVERTAGPMPHEAYVWQRRWEGPVARAIEQASERTSSFTVLLAEVSWRGGNAHVARVRPRYEVLKKSGRPIGLALRIGPYRGPFRVHGKITQLLTDLAVKMVAEARAAGLEPAELQLDFDCAESKLDGYRTWVTAIRKAVKSVPVTITALPCWLKHRAFERLARASDGYVLQVHSLDPPAGPDQPMTLCDPEKARRWVERAARVGVPFRVALPTYGYIAVFGKNGRFIGLCAEGSGRAWNAGTTLKVVRTDPIAMAGLIQHWSKTRPAALKGIIWYRLPVEGDQLNWKWRTLAAVMAGRTPLHNVKVKVERPQRGLAEIVLVNSGEADASPRLSVGLNWGNQRLIAADGLRGFALVNAGQRGADLRYQGPRQFSMLGPGESWKIGWLRLAEDAEVKTHVSTLRP